MSSRVAKLIMVTGDNNNKFYDMVENPDGSITSTWGRVDVTSTVTHYPVGKKNWDTLLNSKLRKGYKDMTSLRAVSTTKKDFAIIGNPTIASIVQELQAYANKSVSENYTISAEKVTPQMVEAAQRLMDELVPLIAIGRGAQDVNNKLLELYSVIPRKMKNVKHHLLDFGRLEKGNIATAEKLLADEQALLDVMGGQAKVSAVQQDTGSGNDSKTLLDAMGIEIEEPSASEIALIKKHLSHNANQFRKAFRIVNKRTQNKFNKHIDTVSNKTVMPFWHGSRNENWWSIIETGLILRPTNAVITGKYFGYGIYFADKAQKSIGYTSLNGSYWAKGGSSKAFLSLYEVHVGHYLKIKHHESWCGDLNKSNLRRRGDYDSLFAEGGADLRNNEYIIYDDVQCTIKFLVEIGS